MNFAHFCEFWYFSSGKQARFTSNFCSGMPPGNVHELAFLWFGLPGWLLIYAFFLRKSDLLPFEGLARLGPWFSLENWQEGKLQSSIRNFSQFESSFFSFKQVIQDKDVRIVWPQEGGQNTPNILIVAYVDLLFWRGFEKLRPALASPADALLVQGATDVYTTWALSQHDTTCLQTSVGRVGAQYPLTRNYYRFFVILKGFSRNCTWNSPF